MSTPDQFKAVMARWGTDTNGFLDEVHRQCIILVTEEIVGLSPVVTGRTRSSYVWGDTPGVSSEPVSIDFNGTPSIANAEAFANKAHAGGVVYVSNSVPYIGDLEYGTRERRPYAMFRTVEARWVNIGKQAVKRALR